MTKREKIKHWKQLIVAGITEPLDRGSLNGAFKEELEGNDYDDFCHLEQNISARIKKMFKQERNR